MAWIDPWVMGRRKLSCQAFSIQDRMNLDESQGSHLALKFGFPGCLGQCFGTLGAQIGLLMVT